MPELPEVETTLRGLMPHLTGQRVSKVVIRHPQLRWPVPRNLPKLLRGATIRSLHRRAKYLLVEFDHGTLLLHLGMSGSLRMLPHGTPAGPHDHFDLELDSDTLVRLRDPRRFGAVLWHAAGAAPHPLLKDLGPEPLNREFNTTYLYRMTRKRSTAIKQVIMNSHVVVGVGNIYANEALFLAGINPQTSALKLTMQQNRLLVNAIKQTLRKAIRAGGSTLRDFVSSTGEPGYFQQNYWVYGREGEPCRKCDSAISLIRQCNRSSFYCPKCQHR